MKTLWHKAESCFQEHLEHLNLALISLKLSQTKHEKNLSHNSYGNKATGLSKWVPVDIMGSSTAKVFTECFVNTFFSYCTKIIGFTNLAKGRFLLEIDML